MSISTESLIKIGFPLEVDGDWPPYSTEHLWAEPVDDGYVVKSFPFFVKGVSFNDTLTGDIDQDGYISDWKVIRYSANSTIWIISSEGSKIIEDLEAIGCGSEAGATDNLFTVNIPDKVRTEDVERVLDSYEDDENISIAYSAYRR